MYLILEHGSQIAVPVAFFQTIFIDQEQNMAVPKQRRSSGRKMRSHDAWITIEGDERSHQCKVADVSADGARLLSEADVTVGSRLKLSTSQHATVSRLCEVMWRRGRWIGIKFAK
jgi:hypothetical protein